MTDLTVVLFDSRTSVFFFFFFFCFQLRSCTLYTFNVCLDQEIHVEIHVWIYWSYKQPAKLRQFLS